MARLLRELTRTCIALILLTASASCTQFYSAAEQFGVAFGSGSASNGSDVFLTLTAPTKFQWAAVGTGDKMDGSFMILMQPSGTDVRIAVLSAHDHDEPEEINTPVHVLHSVIADGRMSAQILVPFSATQQYSTALVEASKQPWIWAVGPQTGDQDSENDDDRVGARKKRDAGAQDFAQHSSYGIFFADMTKATKNSDSAAAISGTSNVAVLPQAHYYKDLVYVHAVLLGLAFVIVFPFGVVSLRLRWRLSLRIHTILQSVTTIASAIGLAVAIALSVVGVEYDDFDEIHQVFGIVIIALLAAQVVGGTWHHRRFQKTGRRFAISYAHMLLGRLLIYGGMVNAVLGCLLADDSIIAYVIAAISFVLACLLEFFSYRQRKHPAGTTGKFGKHGSSSDIPLQTPATDYEHHQHATHTDHA